MVTVCRTLPPNCLRRRHRWIEGLLTANDGVSQDEYLASHGNDDDLGCFAGAAHPLNELGKCFVVPFGAEGAHVEDPAQALRAHTTDPSWFLNRPSRAMFLGRKPSKGRERLGVDSAMFGSSASRMVAEISPKPVMPRGSLGSRARTRSAAIIRLTCAMTSSICRSSHSTWTWMDAATAGDAYPAWLRLSSWTRMILSASHRRTSSRSSRRWAAGGVHVSGTCARQNRAINAASSLSVLLRANSLAAKALTLAGFTILTRKPWPNRNSARRCRSCRSLPCRRGEARLDRGGV